MQRAVFLPRRRALGALALLPACGTAPGVSTAPPPGPTPPLAPTPACPDSGPTAAQTEGPYWKPKSPERATLREPGVTGKPMVLEGRVVTRACAPVAGALVDLWHCDGAGVYDNDGFRLRGHQRAGAAGDYRFETVTPGLYPGRTRHFHVKVQAPGRPVLTTQLYFPDEPSNASDGIFHPSLILAIDRDQAGDHARFTFVLDV